MYIAGVSVCRVEDITEALWRTRVIGSFPDGESALMLVATRLRYISNSGWSKRKYLNMELFVDYNLEDKVS